MPNPASICLFSSFSHHNEKKSKNLAIKIWDSNPGWQNGGWAQTNPLSYGGTPVFVSLNTFCWRVLSRKSKYGKEVVIKSVHLISRIDKFLSNPKSVVFEADTSGFTLPKSRTRFMTKINMLLKCLRQILQV